MRSEATTVKEYMDSLPEDRRKSLAKVRTVIRKNLPKGYQETMNWGMISYEVPLKKYPDTYNKEPLLYAGLASQKNHMAVYLWTIYTDGNERRKFEKAYKATGKRFDCGKSCVRFKSLEDLPLPLIGKTVASMEVDDFIAMIEKAGSARKTRRK